MSWLLAFLGMVLVDALWALYIKAVADHEELAAASWSALVLGAGGGVTLGYVNDPWLLVPACAGAFVGTGLSLRWQRIHLG